MTSILVSSDNASVREHIAKQVAESLKYDYVGNALLEDVAGKHGIPGGDLREVVVGHPGPPGKLNKRLQAGLVFLEAALSERLLDDNVVIDGLAAHLHVRGVSHILNVRVLSDVRSQAHRLAVERHISPKAARKILEKREKQTQQWSLAAFGIDETSPSSYDMIISLGNIEEKRAVTTIVDTANDRKFRPMTYSRKCLENLALADRVRAALVASFPKVHVTAEDGTVKLYVAKRWFGWQTTAETLRDLAVSVEGVDHVEIHTSPPLPEAPVADVGSA